MKTVKEVSNLTGISVRTLHHYDAIGLLKPTELTEAGYRLYDDTALERLQIILLFRELQFPLKDIKAMLDSPTFNTAEALSQQIALLELEYKRLGELIIHARNLQQKEGLFMNFEPFNTQQLDAYKTEAKAKWGDTVAYAEYAQKEAKGKDFNSIAAQMMQVFAELGTLRHLPPDDDTVQQKIAALQQFITDNFYTCTKEILYGLGQMYTADERFTQNIDKAGGEGTAQFASEAIKVYCER
ncbi:MAG: MerR family transcriptional regulator [Peptococcaceae bacterium]|nr:MerR family transcriptional regulator [Peptococcaceae bacterium]